MYFLTAIINQRHNKSKENILEIDSYTLFLRSGVAWLEVRSHIGPLLLCECSLKYYIIPFSWGKSIFSPFFDNLVSKISSFSNKAKDALSCRANAPEKKREARRLCCLCDFLFLSRLLANATWRASLQLQEPLLGAMTFSSCNLKVSATCCKSLQRFSGSNLDPSSHMQHLYNVMRLGQEIRDHA